jgi:peptidoglycan/LPS O-acetylase OafA/YrhL
MATGTSAAMPSRPLALAGIVLIVIVGVIHLVEAPEYLEEETYIGVLFILNAIGAGLSAAGIRRGLRAGWLLGVVVAAGAFIAFILSRTTGLPSFKEEDWEGLGIVTLVLEAAFCAVAARALAGRPAPSPDAVRA